MFINLFFVFFLFWGGPKFYLLCPNFFSSTKFLVQFSIQNFISYFLLSSKSFKSRLENSSFDHTLTQSITFFFWCSGVKCLMLGSVMALFGDFSVSCS